MLSKLITKPCLSVVIPAYNEEATLRQVIDKVLLLECLQEIILVDDCSSDRTPDIAKSLARQDQRVVVIRHARNAGKTEALKTGFKRTKGAIVIVQDADLEYDPDEIPMLIQPIVEGQADVVYGSRFLGRKATCVYHYLGNRALTFLSNVFTNVKLTDVETGYKAFRGEIIREMLITSDGFGFEIEVTAKVTKLRCAMHEVPISYHRRTYEEGKKIRIRDGIAALWYILKFNCLQPPGELPESSESCERMERESDSIIGSTRPALTMIGLFRCLEDFAQHNTLHRH